MFWKETLLSGSLKGCEGPTSESCFLGWVGLLARVGLFREVGSSARMVSTAAAHASGRPPSVFLASPPSKACAMRSPASSEQRDRPSGLLCGRLLLALVESVLRPGGWENMCRLMCHCVRHIGLDNKHGRSVEAIHSFLSRWKACTELCAGTHKSRAAREVFKSSMGSENCQRCSPRFRKSALMRSVPPRFDRAARKTRRALAVFLRL